MSLSSKGYTSSFRGSVDPGAYATVLASDFSSAGSSPNLALGIAGNYAILAYSGITNTGNTVISGGNIGSSPTQTETGFPPGQIKLPGVIDNANAAAARTAGLAAYTTYAALSFTSLSATSVDLSTAGVASSNVFVPGNYSAGTSMAMSTGIVLNGAGVYIFKAGSTVNLASGQSITLTNGATADNVIWLVGSSLTTVATSTFIGTVLAVTSISLGGGTFIGHALAVGGGNGAVTIAAATTFSTETGAAATLGIQNPLPLIAAGSTFDYVFVIPNTGSEWKVQKSVNYARPNGTTETAGIIIDGVDCVAPPYPGVGTLVTSSLSPSAYFSINGTLFLATTTGTTAATFIGVQAFNTTKGAFTTDGTVIWQSLGKAVIIRARFANASLVSATPVAQEYDWWLS
jgi:hypothetical protein